MCGDFIRRAALPYDMNSCLEQLLGPMHHITTKRAMPLSISSLESPNACRDSWREGTNLPKVSVTHNSE